MVCYNGCIMVKVTERREIITATGAKPMATEIDLFVTRTFTITFRKRKPC